MKKLRKILLCLNLIASYGLNAATPPTPPTQPSYVASTSSELNLTVQTTIFMKASNVQFPISTDQFDSLDSDECYVSFVSPFQLSGASATKQYEVYVRNYILEDGMTLYGPGGKQLKFQLAYAPALPNTYGGINKSLYEETVQNLTGGGLISTLGGKFYEKQSGETSVNLMYQAYFTREQLDASDMLDGMDGTSEYNGTLLWTYQEF